MCGDRRLASADQRLADLYASLLGRLPKEEGERLRSAQKDWLARRAACGREGSGKDALSCVAHAYDSRIRVLEWLRDSRFHPEGIALERLRSVNDQLEIDVAYPVLAKDRPGAAAFNAFFLAQARQLASRVEPAEAGQHLENSVTAEFAVRLATARLVTVLWRAYLYEGGPHGLPVTSATTFDLERGRPLALEDVFDAAKPWQGQLLKLALARVEERDEDMGDDAGAKEIVKADNWTFQPTGAVLTFPVYSIAPYPSGEPEARFTWEELRPFLRAGSPLPLH